ncbi:MAG: hypothetical protein C0399_11480 [Syntrophus sp. (in: bacteria)]|nr:hypothetical protein [Syntrophus sp. (in: bacteria)]MBA4418916.1 hypothetical protein [Syntrophus sp. (in: bacteria)]
MKAVMRKVMIIHAVLFILLPVLRAGTELHHNPINNTLIKSIIKVESSGDPKAISREGAWGLMQVRHAVWEKELKEAGIISDKQELFNPEKNIRAGKYILTKYYGQTGCLEKTLKKYSGNKKRYFDKIMIEYWKHMMFDHWFSSYRHKPFDSEPERMRVKIRWQSSAADDWRVDVLEKYRTGAGR